MINPTPEPVKYDTRYALLCESAHDAHTGILTTLDRIVTDSDIIVPDTSLIPTIKNDIANITPRQASTVSFVYKKLGEIFASDKLRMHHSIHGELVRHLQNEYDAASQLPKTRREHANYVDAIAEVKEKLPGPAALPRKYEGINHEFLQALTYVDDILQLRHTKRFQKSDQPTKRDLENMAYALTLAVTNPEKKHTILGRDIDYQRLFDAVIKLAYSKTFTVKNANAETVAQKLGNPKLQITYCDDQHKNHPYTIVRSTGKTPIGQDYIWNNVPESTRAGIIQQLQLNFAKIFHEKKELGNKALQDQATLPVAKTMDAGSINTIYQAMRITDKDIERKAAEGSLMKVLQGYCEIYSLAQHNNAAQTTKEMQEDLKSVEKYLLTAQQKDAINSKNVHTHDKTGKLEDLIESQRTLRETAKLLSMNKLVSAASYSIGVAKSYVQRMHAQVKTIRGELVQEIDGLKKDLADSSQKYADWGAQNTRYERLRELLKGETAAPLDAVIAGESKRHVHVEGQEKFGGIVYDNLCTILGRKPVEGEKLAKGQLVKALTFNTTSFKNFLEKANISADQVPRGPGRKHFFFSEKLLNDLGNVMTISPKLITE